ncbi:MAG TPA: peptidoglycan bridge formation glycyltransferase FemA/FemB family protein, partial [Spirochaetia bacterium]|nr:peptidoglycan bridge formation glycyltransferase FemA/FemB family protein [Spirochaetia bacterium]
MRRQAARHGSGVEGQGEVIEASPAPLSALDRSAELLQTGFWGSFKQAHGWKASAFSVRPEAGTPFDLLVLSRRIARAASLAYIPFGPRADPGDARGTFLSELAAAIRPELPADTLLVRFDLPWAKEGGAPSEGSRRPMVRHASMDVQPPNTVIVDLSPEPDAILAAMKPKTRYNIRLAEKKGVKVREALPGELDAWYELYRETGRRDRIAIHSASYYRELLQAPYPGDRPSIVLLVATHEGDLLAGNIVSFWKESATYLYGASSGKKRNLMPTYAL